MKNIKTTILLLTIIISFFSVHAQEKSVIRGRIIDKTDKLGIPGVNIIEYDSGNRTVNGTITNVDGDFVYKISNPANKIVIRNIGYKPYDLKPNFTKSIIIELVSENFSLDEVVVKGELKANAGLTNIEERDKATSSVKLDLLESSEGGVSSAEDALQGKVAGLDIISSSGDPGSSSQIVIRGLSSMGNSKPLIVIDGIPQFTVSGSIDLSGADQEDISNLINIPLQDIKSIEVLKDAGSTAIYGSQGADGVLLIETKKGRMGKVQFDYQYKRSSSIQPPAVPMLNGDEYIMLQLEEWHNSLGVFDVPTEIAYDTDNKDFFNYSANTDWLKEITQIGTVNDHYFSISGGGEKARFFNSFSYADEVGTTVNTRGRKFSTRVNLDYLLSKNVLFQIKFDYFNNVYDGNLKLKDEYWKDRNVRDMAYIKSPNMSIWEHDANGNLTGEYFNPIYSYQGAGTLYFNPVAVANLGINKKVENNVKNSFMLQFRLNPWLVLRETVSFQYSGTKQNTFLPYNAIGADWTSSSVNKAREENLLGNSIRTETQVSFTSPFKSKDHQLSGVVSWVTDQSKTEGLVTETSRSSSIDLTDPAVNAQVGSLATGSVEKKSLSMVGNVNYKFKDRYMITSNTRTDASSVFGSSNRMGVFTGLSGAWRFSDELFLDELYWLDDSKIRISWGIVGRQPDKAYARFSSYVTTDRGAYIDHTAIAPENMELSNLRWEKTKTTNLGLDISLFKGRFNISGEIYDKITTDILFEDYDLPSISGYDKLKYFNGGELSNNGWEVMFDSRIIQKKDFSFSVNFNTSHNQNAFTKLPLNFNPEKSTTIGNGQYPLLVQEGKPIGSFFGFRYLGVFASDADAVAHDADGNIMYHSDGSPIPFRYLDSYTFKGGDPIYKDLNHDGKIDINDVEKIGDSNPAYIGGFGANIKYKDFSISASFQYRIGFDIINGIALKTEGMNDRNNQSKAVLNRWRLQGQSEPGLLPRAYMNHPANNLGSDRYVEKGDFLRFNDLKFSYKLNNELCSKLGIRSGSVTFSARKFLIITNYTGQDPEVGQDASDPFWIGEDKAQTPQPRVFTLTLGVGL